MTDRVVVKDHPEDLPWRDAPADRIFPASQEPAPAEVVGGGADEEAPAIDLAAPPVPEPFAKYQPETLERRLAEEEPDVWAWRHQEEEAVALLAPEAGSDLVVRAEADKPSNGADEEPSAEEAAVHILEP